MNKYIITIKHRKRIRRGSIYAEVLRATLDLPTDEIAIKVGRANVFVMPIPCKS